MGKLKDMVDDHKRARDTAARINKAFNVATYVVMVIFILSVGMQCGHY